MIQSIFTKMIDELIQSKLLVLYPSTDVAGFASRLIKCFPLSQQNVDFTFWLSTSLITDSNVEELYATDTELMSVVFSTFEREIQGKKDVGLTDEVLSDPLTLINLIMIERIWEFDNPFEVLQRILIPTNSSWNYQVCRLLEEQVQNQNDVLQLFNVDGLIESSVPPVDSEYMLYFIGMVAKYNIQWCNSITELHIVGPVFSLSKNIHYLSNLEVLKAYRCEIEHIAPEIGQLSKLRILNLGYNKLDDLPDSIGQLSKLEEISLVANPIALKELPSSIGNLQSLKKLYIWLSDLYPKDEVQRKLNNQKIEIIG